MLQLQKTHANRKKHLQIKKTTSSVWQHTRCKCSQHNQQRNALHITCICLCCEHLQCVSLFVCVVSICSVFLYLFVLWAFSPSTIKLMKMLSWFAGALSICMCFLKLQHVELSQPPYIRLTERLGNPALRKRSGLLFVRWRIKQDTSEPILIWALLVKTRFFQRSLELVKD